MMKMMRMWRIFQLRIDILHLSQFQQTKDFWGLCQIGGDCPLVEICVIFSATIVFKFIFIRLIFALFFTWLKLKKVVNN